MTCDRVKPTLNVGTALAYSDVACRVRGPIVADLVNDWISHDPDVAADPSLLSDNFRSLIYSLRGAPFELTKLLFKSTNAVAANDYSLIPQAHAAVPVAVARLLVFSLKAAVRAAASKGPVNMANFLKNGTTSRFSPLELLTAIAYLQSRDPTSPFACSNCVPLNTKVAENVNANLLRWITGLAIADKGQIADEEITRKQCMLTNQAHGAAFELVATAAYHAMFEFAGKREFEILAADPRPEIEVALMHKPRGRVKHYGNSPHKRAPDLILEGEGSGKRYWVELKSWRFKSNYVNANKTLNAGRFPRWNGKSRSTRLKYTTQAHRQHFLDFAAEQDALLADYWNTNRADPRDRDLKPASHRTWMQVWKSEQREFVPFRKKGRKSPGPRQVINVATPWIDTARVPLINTRFRLLQEFLTSAPSKISAGAYKQSIGYARSEHARRYQQRNIGRLDGTVAPFTLSYMLLTELGNSQAELDKISRGLEADLGSSELGQFLGLDNLSDEQVAALRKVIQDKVEENLGFIKPILDKLDKVTPDKVIEYENKVQDYINGWLGDSAQGLAREIELPESLFDTFCEVP